MKEAASFICACSKSPMLSTRQKPNSSLWRHGDFYHKYSTTNCRIVPGTDPILLSSTAFWTAPLSPNPPCTDSFPLALDTGWPESVWRACWRLSLYCLTGTMIVLQLNKRASEYLWGASLVAFILLSCYFPCCIAILVNAASELIWGQDKDNDNDITTVDEHVNHAHWKQDLIYYTLNIISHDNMKCLYVVEIALYHHAITLIYRLFILVFVNTEPLISVTHC